MITVRRFDFKPSIVAIVCLLLFLVQHGIIQTSYAQQRITIKPDADVFVLHTKQTDDKNMKDDFLQVAHPLNLIEHYGTMVAYIRFDIGTIPHSNLPTDNSIDSAELRLFAYESNGSHTNYLVTVNYCNNSSWSETTMTWNTRVCRDINGITPMDSIVVGNDLPRYYSWVVTEGLNNVINMNQDRITFKITGYALNTNQIGDLIFWSKEKEMKDPIYAATPDTLIVNYTTKPSALQVALGIAAAVVLPIVGGVWGVSHWLYLRRRPTAHPGG